MVPIIKGLKHNYPQSRISVLTSIIGKQVFENQPEVEEVFVVNKQKIEDLVVESRLESILSAARMLESDIGPALKIKWDWVINFTFTFPSALLSFILNAKQVSGFTTTRDRYYLSKEKWFAHTLASFVNRRYSNFNWVDINSNIIGVSSVPNHSLIGPNPGDVSKATAHLRRIGFNDKRTIGMHPGASGDHKRWPIERFGELGRLLVKKHGYKIIIFGDEKEKDLSCQLEDLIGDGAHNMAGKTTLDELKAYLSLCDRLVTNDTGPMHLASALGTRIIGLFFTTHFVETGPYGPSHAVAHPDIDCFPCQSTANCLNKKCLEHISPETIERIVVEGRSFEKERGMDFLGREKGLAKVYFSIFDPWGFIEWRPLDRSAITFLDIERISLKTSWLHFSNIIGTDDKSEDKYITDILSYYDGPLNKANLRLKIKQIIEQLLSFKCLLESANKISFEIQSKLLEQNMDTTSVRHLGETLNDTEAKLSSYDKKTSLSFLSELLAIFRENIEPMDTLSLATKTIGIYKDMILITDIMIKQVDKMGKLFSVDK